ncbi:MAG: PSP1 domain-containing protein [Treponemataceae bacterium]
MSEIFDNQIDDIDLSLLEDGEGEKHISTENYVFPTPLYRLKLEYSNESIYATIQGSLTVDNGDYVLIPTRYGKDLAKVMGLVKVPIGIMPEDVVFIDRKVNEADLERFESLKKKESAAFDVFNEKVSAHKLNMKLISSHYLLDEPKIIFFFSSDNRVDFRELVKDLVAVFKMRIELRQIGVRDESRIIGGLGICGRPYCCHAVSDRLRPVSIRMAKDQNLSLNSLKISGQCGRLLCCLSYEHDWYMDARKKLPYEGAKFKYDGTIFRVASVNPLTMMTKISGEDGRLLELPASRLRYIDGNWKVIR